MGDRIDVWLFRTRFFKTRTGAAKAIKNGKIRLTRGAQSIRLKKPHSLIHMGDTLTFMRGTQLIQAEMLLPGTRRGPAVEAQTLYRLIETED